jgi:hypothetical protein
MSGTLADAWRPRNPVAPFSLPMHNVNCWALTLPDHDPRLEAAPYGESW